MASKKTLIAKSLQALGTQRLAELLIEVSSTNAAVKRRLRLELAAAQSPGEVAKEIRKRLTTIARSSPILSSNAVMTVPDFDIVITGSRAASVTDIDTWRAGARGDAR